MEIQDGEEHRAKAGTLIRQVVDEHDPRYGVGSMTCSIYDTAWVAMVRKKEEGEDEYRWLFPSAFEYLLKHQHHDGGWHSGSSVEADAILSTLAALLAVTRHIKDSKQLAQSAQEDLLHRRKRAAGFLEQKLSGWNADLAPSNGFELIAPKLLDLLASEGVKIRFQASKALETLRKKASARINASLIYGTTRSAAAIYLEALTGEVDFDMVEQHRISGSIMASPSATAAYLMHCTEWDQDAETYLSHVLEMGDENSRGGVPSQYPSTVFEVTQALSALLTGGFSHEELGDANLENAADFLDACLQIDAGVTGSAPFMESDADSTAKTLSCLTLLGRTPNPHGLLVRFEARDFFKTFTQERSPSFRTNCLVLKALLDLLPGNSEQNAQIEKTTRFVANCWWTTNGHLEDATNTAPNYPIMLMVDAFAKLVSLWEQGFAPILGDAALNEKVFICLYQALTHLLQEQKSNGSWGSRPNFENTAYAVLTLTKLAHLSAAPRVKAQVVEAVEKGRKYLADNFRQMNTPDLVWRCKTAVGSTILSQAFILAALHVQIPCTEDSSVETVFDMSVAQITIRTKYFAKQAWFANVPEWQIQACLVESYLFLPQLKNIHYSVFPENDGKDDQYFDAIPFAWLAASNFDRRYIGPEFIYQMMILCFLNRQLDDYVQHHIAQVFSGCLFEVEEIIYDIFDELEQLASQSQEDHPPRQSVASNATVEMSEARGVLRRLISHVLNHPYVLMASFHDQARLQSEFLAYLLGRIRQLPDDSAGATTEPHGGADLASDQTHHPFTFAFLSCLVGNQSSLSNIGLRKDFLDTPEQQYLAAAMCRHLSIVSFMSATAPEHSLPATALPSTPVKTRISSFGMDRFQRRSISSVSDTNSTFSDDQSSPISALSSNSSAPDTSASDDEAAKAALLQSTSPETGLASHSLQLTRLLSHERKCLNISLQSLDATGINQKTANILGLFVDLSELSELIFRDPNVGASTRNATPKGKALPFAAPERPPTPPRKAPSRGSVAQARAALTIAPLATIKDVEPGKPGVVLESEPQSSTSAESFKTAFSSAQAPTPAPPVPSREFNFLRRTSRSLLVNQQRASRSDLEMIKIEQIMSNMSENATAPAPPPKELPISKTITSEPLESPPPTPISKVAPEPQPAPIAKVATIPSEQQPQSRPQTRPRANTTNGRSKTDSKVQFVADEPKRLTYAPTSAPLVTNLDAFSNSGRKLGEPLVTNLDALTAEVIGSRSTAEGKKLQRQREKEQEELQRRRASGYQSLAMEQVARSMTVSKKRENKEKDAMTSKRFDFPKEKGRDLEKEREKELEKAREKEREKAEQAWEVEKARFLAAQKARDEQAQGNKKGEENDDGSPLMDLQTALALPSLSTSASAAAAAAAAATVEGATRGRTVPPKILTGEKSRQEMFASFSWTTGKDRDGESTTGSIGSSAYSPTTIKMPGLPPFPAPPSSTGLANNKIYGSGNGSSLTLTTSNPGPSASTGGKALKRAQSRAELRRDPVTGQERWVKPRDAHGHGHRSTKSVADAHTNMSYLMNPPPPPPTEALPALPTKCATLNTAGTGSSSLHVKGAQQAKEKEKGKGVNVAARRGSLMLVMGSHAEKKEENAKKTGPKLRLPF